MAFGMKSHMVCKALPEPPCEPPVSSPATRNVHPRGISTSGFLHRLFPPLLTQLMPIYKSCLALYFNYEQLPVPGICIVHNRCLIGNA